MLSSVVVVRRVLHCSRLSCVVLCCVWLAAAVEVHLSCLSIGHFGYLGKDCVCVVGGGRGKTNVYLHNQIKNIIIIKQNHVLN